MTWVETELNHDVTYKRREINRDTSNKRMKNTSHESSKLGFVTRSGIEI
jgi:hypothetical protein